MSVNSIQEIINVYAPPMGKFNAELDVIKTDKNKKLILTWKGTYKELTKKDGRSHFEVTGEFNKIPDIWKEIM